MKKGEKEDKGGGVRLLHIRVSEELHRRLRIRAAELDTTMQEIVERIIEKEFGKKNC